MFTKFWDELAEGLAGRWAAQALGPAMAFWGGGILAAVWGAGQDWQAFVDWLVALNDPAVYIGLAVGGLVVLTTSAALMTWLQLPALRLLEGYWPWPLRRLRFSLARALTKKRLQKKEARWQELAAIESQARSAAQASAYARLDAELARYPVDPRHLLPTRVGNVLRAAEEYPQTHYGLAAGVFWPRLWQVIPEEPREALVQARHNLDSTVRLFVWGVLFAVWTVWAWWAALVAVVVAFAAYWRMCHTAGVYGDLLRATFDLHRFALYEAARWPPPEDTRTEWEHGEQFTEYLFRGLTKEKIIFDNSEE